MEDAGGNPEVGEESILPQGSPSQQPRNAYQLCCSPPGKNSSGPRRPLRVPPLWRSPCWHLRMTQGWHYSRFPSRTWSLIPPRWMRSRWRSLGRQDAGLEHGKEEGMNGQTNVCLCGVWSCQPAAKYLSCKSPKKGWITGIYHQAMSSRSLGSYPDNQNLVCWANGPGSTKADMAE